MKNNIIRNDIHNYTSSHEKRN